MINILPCQAFHLIDQEFSCLYNLCVIYQYQINNCWCGMIVQLVWLFFFFFSTAGFHTLIHDQFPTYCNLDAVQQFHIRCKEVSLSQHMDSFLRGFFRWTPECHPIDTGQRTTMERVDKLWFVALLDVDFWFQNKGMCLVDKAPRLNVWSLWVVSWWK